MYEEVERCDRNRGIELRPDESSTLDGLRRFEVRREAEPPELDAPEWMRSFSHGPQVVNQLRAKVSGSRQALQV